MVNKRYPLKVNAKMLKRYNSLGYECKSGDIIYLFSTDISKGSRANVELLCDYCLDEGIETILFRPYFKFVNGRKHIEKDACDKCKIKKTREIIKIKYNVEHQSQLDSVKIALREAKLLDFSIVETLFEKRNYLLISSEDDYKNNTSKLRYICLNHVEFGEQSICYGNLQQGIGCYHCGRKSARNKLKHSFDFVRDTFSQNNLTLISKQYINSNEKLEFMCNVHPDEGVQYTTFINLQDSHKVCRKCYIESKRGDNCNFWNGGTTELLRHLRSVIVDWKKETLKKDGYTCILSGIKGKLQVHHLYSFHKIVKESLDKLNLPLLREVKDYSKDQLILIEKEITKRHRKMLGVCLIPSIHNLYHSIYRYDNTPEQFEKFKIRYNSGEFKDLIKID